MGGGIENSKIEVELAIVAPWAREQIPGLLGAAEERCDDSHLILEYGLGVDVLRILDADAARAFDDPRKVRLRKYEGGDVVFTTKGSQLDGRKDGSFKLSAREETDCPVNDESLHHLVGVEFEGGVQGFLFKLKDHVQAVTLRQRFYFDGDLRREIGEILDVPNDHFPYCHLDIVDGPVENGVLVKIDVEFPESVADLNESKIAVLRDTLWEKRQRIAEALERFLGIRELNFKIPKGQKRPSKTDVGQRQWQTLNDMRGEHAERAARVISLERAMFQYGDNLGELRIRKPML